MEHWLVKNEFMGIVRALYDYVATCDGELSLKVGDLIQVVSKETGSSSWWEGKSHLGIGQRNCDCVNRQFPNNYVEIHDDPVNSRRPSIYFNEKPEQSKGERGRV